MLKLNYIKDQDDAYFSRFRAQNLANWPIDFMYVNDKTFKLMFQKSRSENFGETTAKVVSLDHLIILKLHALRSFQEHRYVKDYTDLLALLRSKGTFFDSEDFREICLKYANAELFNQVMRDLASSGQLR